MTQNIKTLELSTARLVFVPGPAITLGRRFARGVSSVASSLARFDRLHHNHQCGSKLLFVLRVFIFTVIQIYTVFFFCSNFLPFRYVIFLVPTCLFSYSLLRKPTNDRIRQRDAELALLRAAAACTTPNVSGEEEPPFFRDENGQRYAVCRDGI